MAFEALNLLISILVNDPQLENTYPKLLALEVSIEISKIYVCDFLAAIKHITELVTLDIEFTEIYR